MISIYSTCWDLYLRKTYMTNARNTLSIVDITSAEHCLFVDLLVVVLETIADVQRHDWKMMLMQNHWIEM